MKRGFLSQKGSEVRRGVKGKQVLMADKSVEAHGIHSHVSANEENMHDASTINNVAKNCTTVGPNPAGNTPGMSISYANVIGVPIKKALNFHTLFTPTGNGVDVEECPKNIEVGMAKVLKKPTQAPRGVLAGPKCIMFLLPKTVLKEIDSLLMGFLWCNEEFSRGKALPGRKFGWKNLLEIRDKVIKNVWYKLGNGESTSMWYDNWCELGPLFRFISNRSLYSVRFSKDMVVVGMVSNGDWKWPISKPYSGWEDIINELAKKPNECSIWSIVRRMCLATDVYSIWKERNNRVFRDETCKWEVVLGNICETMRLKLMGLKVKNSKAVLQEDRMHLLKGRYSVSAPELHKKPRRLKDLYAVTRRSHTPYSRINSRNIPDYYNRGPQSKFPQ
ncbi:hypothetical protein Tco_0787017 [Tanacetum coccineum]